MSDYPDFFLHVERSPIQPTPYQDIVIYNYLDRQVAANSVDRVNVTPPNDGYYYNIDNVCFSCNAGGLMRCAISYCSDINNPVWYVVAVSSLTYDCIIPVSHQGVLAIKYPGAVQLYFRNTAAKTVKWSAYVTTMRYRIV